MTNAISDVFPVSREAMLDELKSSRALLEKWEKRLSDFNEEEPHDPDEVRQEINNLMGEVTLVSGKLDSIVRALMLSEPGIS